MILSSAVFMIEKYKSPVGDGNCLTIATRTYARSIEKYKSPVGDGNVSFQDVKKSTATIEKYKSPVGDGNLNGIMCSERRYD